MESTPKKQNLGDYLTDRMLDICVSKVGSIYGVKQYQKIISPKKTK